MSHSGRTPERPARPGGDASRRDVRTRHIGHTLPFNHDALRFDELRSENSPPWVVLFQSLRFDMVVVPWWIPVRIPEPHWTFNSHDARGSDVFVFDRQTGEVRLTTEIDGVHTVFGHSWTGVEFVGIDGVSPRELVIESRGSTGEHQAQSIEVWSFRVGELRRLY